MADTVELTVRMEQVEHGLEREIGKREQSDKYNHRMIEDVQARYQDIVVTFGRIEAAFKQHLEDDRQMSQGIVALDARFRTIERLVWVAVGGIAIIGVVFGVAVSVLLHYLPK